jgi:hypothetical protein
MLDLGALNERSVGKFPGFLGVVFTYLDGTEIGAELCIRDEFMAPNGCLHAGSAGRKSAAAGSIQSPTMRL